MGPIFSAERALKTIASGDLTQGIRTRRDDELKGFTDELSAMREGLRHFVENDRNTCRVIDQKLAKISSSLAGGEPLPELREEMEAIRKELAKVSSQFRI